MVPILLLHVALTFPAAGLSGDARRAAIAEIAAIWSPQGVVVATDSGALGADHDVAIRVEVARRPSALGDSGAGPLASIRFDAAGMPVPVITLYLTSLVEMIAGANSPGSGRDSAPALLRQRALGRAVGRVLAHELGHYLLRSRWHASSGLMRPVQSTADLVGRERGLFALAPADVARLAAVAASDAMAAAADCFGAP